MSTHPDFELVDQPIPDSMRCPLCGFGHASMTVVYRRNPLISYTDQILASIPPAVIGWILMCGCMLGRTEWTWTARPDSNECGSGYTARWERRTPAPKGE